MKAPYLTLLAAALLLLGCRERDQSRSANGPVPEEYGAAGASVAPGKSMASDQALNNKLRESLRGILTNQETNDFVIDSHAGLVTIKGRVATKALKEDISRSIKQTDGVTDIRNELQVDPSVDVTLQRNDEAQASEKAK